MSCTSITSNGRNKNCEVYLKETRAAIIVEAGGYTFTKQQLNNISTWKPYLAENTNGIVVEFNGSEPTDAEAVVETTGYGQNLITGENAPTLLGYAKSNACDFTDMLDSFDGGTYEVFLYNSGGLLIAARAVDKQKGFKTQVWAHAKGAVGSDAQTQQYRITLNFLDEFEWRKPANIKVNYDLFELNELIPIGLDMPYEVQLNASGQASFPISLRCVENSEQSETYTGNILSHNISGSTPTATPSYNGTTEQYDWVVTTDGSTAPSYGDVFYVRAELVTSGVKEKVSNVVKFTVIDS